jgi:hypothetical protein
MSHSHASRPGDLPFASLLSGAYGSGAIALFFLLLDSIRGEPFFTPSFMGSVVVMGVPAEEVSTIRLDAMAVYTVVHFLAFVALGTAVSLGYSRVQAMPRNAIALGTVILVALTIGTLGVDRLLIPGIIDGIGALPLVIGNLITSAVMAIVIVRSFASTSAIDSGALSGPMAAQP